MACDLEDVEFIKVQLVDLFKPPLSNKSIISS